MNPIQMAQQIKSKIQAITWPSGSANLVFGDRGVKVITGPPTDSQVPAAWPWCMVMVDSGEGDEEHPELYLQDFNILTGVMVTGDPMGEFSAIGSSIGDVGTSAGHGLGEVQARARAAIENMNGSDGAQILLGVPSIGGFEPWSRGRHLSMGSQSAQALCTSQPYYAPPQNLRQNGTVWTWEGAMCQDRFDFLQYRMVEKAGTSPSSTPSDGTVIYTGTGPAVNIATSGTVTVFADYSARGAAIEASSEPEVGSFR